LYLLEAIQEKFFLFSHDGHLLCLLLRTTSPGAYDAKVELAMSMSAQEMISDLRAGGEKVDVTLSKVWACLPTHLAAC